ncbi:MAG: cysteine-rich CWC family protein [Myxococcaceae bacterium]|nr:cysteine-rich CWC family protein [Myxococcaceae bacterium]
MSASTIDASRCPLCSKPNGCGLAAGKPDCWCFSVTMDPAALAKVPPEAKGACVCQACGVKRSDAQQKP